MTRKSSISSADLAFAAILSGAYASAFVAVLFLGIDAFRGAVGFTPSLLGSVLFLGVEASPAAPVRVDMVAAYSVIHFLAFTAMGTLATFAYVAETRFQRHPLLLGGAIVVALMVAFEVVDLFVAPGLLTAIGPVAVLVGNVCAAGVMAAFIQHALKPSFAPAPALAGADNNARGA